jgi:hypothetical protein
MYDAASFDGPFFGPARRPVCHFERLRSAAVRARGRGSARPMADVAPAEPPRGDAGGGAQPDARCVRACAQRPALQCAFCRCLSLSLLALC